ncbi:ribosomal protein S18-alanine N-acetyltransferase [Bacillus litorisediminis]|uniref:ribosomal protein S18-alanine N-acetyltransferase n=1 Tax=Bacillus litorisediminis TaxID=2922713 RepID=UPI001FAE4BA0|nr:ribosomal protein S18-alanine N-acetyltransferase [Bacillus litorisediminis]
MNNKNEAVSSAFFRFMTLADLDDIMEIEHQSFTLPWKRDAFVRELTSNPYARYWVVEVNGKVIGYSGVWIVMDEAHITNIAVLPDYRGHGFGKQLLIKTMQLAKSYNAKVVTLEVRVSNIVAQNLYRSLGFQPGGIRKGYYTDNNEDGLIMWVNI